MVNDQNVYSELAGVNIRNNPVIVKHAELERANDNSMFRSVCPICKLGTLMVSRSNESLELVAADHCILCGQHFVYSDINDLKKKVGETK